MVSLKQSLAVATVLLMTGAFSIVSAAAASQDDPCADDYRRIILDDKAYPWGSAKIAAMEKIAGRCAKTTGQYEFRLASLYTEAGKLENAEGLIKQGLAQKTEYKRELDLALGDLYIMRGDLHGAEGQFQRLVKDYPSWAFGYMKIGAVRLDQRRFREAVGFLEKANVLEKNAFTYRCLAIAHSQLGEHEAAVRAVNLAYEMDQSLVSDRDAMLAAVHSYATVGKLEVAKNLLAMALKAQPDFLKDPRYQQAVNYNSKRSEELGHGKE
jgi:tetratricopeptide (TPR) repeat protein